MIQNIETYPTSIKNYINMLTKTSMSIHKNILVEDVQDKGQREKKRIG